MVKGCLYAKDRTHSFYDQTNNAIEQILRKYKNRPASAVNQFDFLESCGPESMMSIREAMGKTVNTGLPLQGADLLTIAFNEPKNYPAMQRVFNVDPDKYMGNEIMQWYPVIVPLVFPDTKVQYEEPLSWTRLTEFIFQGHGVQILLRAGHFRAALLYDSDNDIVLFNDPYPEKKGYK